MQVGFLNIYGGILSVREDRAALVADNIANADTPGYKAVDVPFESALGPAMLDPGATDTGAAATKAAGHPVAPLYRADVPVALDGNDVSLDKERIEAAQNGEAMIGAATFLHQATADLVMALRPNPGGV
jgi:flagellar basal-body rod protein FlgB